MASKSKTGVLHPLEPITAQEIIIAKNVILQRAKQLNLDNIIFHSMNNQEPPKKDLLRFYRDPVTEQLSRIAFCLIQAVLKYSCVEVYVNVQTKEIVSWEVQTGKFTQMTTTEFRLVTQVIKKDLRIQTLCQERNLNIEQLTPDPWPFPYPHSFMEHIKEYDPTTRYMNCFMYYQNTPFDNIYAHPLDFGVIVDVHNRKVVHVINKFPQPPPPVPQKPSNYHPNLFQKPYRTDIKPLHVVQPQGPSFTVQENEVSWQKWNFRVSFNYREGLVLHNVNYDDDGKIRDIIHRGSLVEMVVPYGDPNEPYSYKCALDAGDLGLGRNANTLELGCDCLGSIHYFDFNLCDDSGDPMLMDKCVCLHEEDAGLSWKHVDTSDFYNAYNQSRRARRLVISFISTLANYEYGFYWYFYQDGNIGFESKLTGILSTSYASVDEDPEHPSFGNLVHPLVNAQHHQHIFCMRLDMSIDDSNGGKDLVVSEIDAQPLDYEDEDEGPLLLAFKQKESFLTKEREAQRKADLNVGRYWKISNPNIRNPYTNKPIAYKLMSPNPAYLQAKKGSPVYNRGYFATKSLFVTPHNDDEIFPSGVHTIEMKGPQGLETWTKKDRILLGNDPVIWHSFGVTHFARPEDFPVMPVESVSFMLKPIGFFTENPALDIPPDPDQRSQQINCCHDKSTENRSKL